MAKYKLWSGAFHNITLYQQCMVSKNLLSLPTAHASAALLPSSAYPVCSDALPSLSAGDHQLHACPRSDGVPGDAHNAQVLLTYVMMLYIALRKVRVISARSYCATLQIICAAAAAELWQPLRPSSAEAPGGSCCLLTAVAEFVGWLLMAAALVAVVVVAALLLAGGWL